jgi:hypothetical protein
MQIVETLFFEQLTPWKLPTEVLMSILHEQYLMCYLTANSIYDLHIS